MKNSYLGVDCGSVSIKFALIDEEKNLIASAYLRNQGVIETLKKGLEKIANDEYVVKSVGVTGSGRKLLGMLIGADVIETEILSHTYAALEYYPDVRTIIDIGGEDSKLITINNGVLENFKFNSLCAAGTGSFIDAIASRIGISIDEVGEIALQSKRKLDFPGKCGVFAQSSVVSRLNAGADKSDILMGTIRALVNNYFTIAKGIELYPPYVYQGATAMNKAIVRAIEEQLEYEVIVPENCHIMGAIGAAFLAKEETPLQSKFKGYDCILKSDYKTKTIISNGCENRCELILLYENNHLLGIMGNRCEKCSNLE